MLSFLASSLSFLANEASREISNHQICIFAVWIIWIRYKTFMRVTTAGTGIQRAPAPTQVESTSDSEALDLFRRKPYKPITFLTIIQEPFLSEPIRIIIPIFFSAVVALVIVARDTENFCIICLSVILSFSTMALKIICCLLDS